MFEWIHDCEELETWFYERWLRLQAGLGRDLNHIQLNNHKHKVAVPTGVSLTQHWGSRGFTESSQGSLLVTCPVQFVSSGQPGAADH